jgi:hypothetical protein
MKTKRPQIKRRKHATLLQISIASIMAMGVLVSIVAIGYLVFIHKPNSPEFLVLKGQEQELGAPQPWRRDTSDYGCQRPRFLEHNEIQCFRHIDLVYKDTSVKPALQAKLLSHGWIHYPEDKAMDASGPDFDTSRIVHFDSWDLYAKRVNGKLLCATVELEYNANYKKDAPWAVSLHLFDKTERCDAHVGNQ